MKRLFDIIVSLFGLIVMAPVLLLFMFLIWKQDSNSPFYIAPRIGYMGKPFNMIKLRSMAADADKSGVSSTSVDDIRITKIGHLIRKYKIDEFSQLLNVLCGDMSLVGPRPQVQEGVIGYTNDEKHLLLVRPGITDLASIVFSDEGNILEGSNNPDQKYNQVIRPWKSRLGLLYIDKHTFWSDIYIILLTIVSIFSRPLALEGIQRILTRWEADERLLNVAKRTEPLYAYTPPGSRGIG